MDHQMLAATQQAAIAAQSAADAAWWALVVNGSVVLVAIGTTFFQEWRVQRRIELGERALHQGAVDTVRQGWIAVDEASLTFRAAGLVDVPRLQRRLEQVRRARRLLALFTAREVDPKILIGLLAMDDQLAVAENVLAHAANRQGAAARENAEYNGELNEAASAAERIFISLV
ncbi:MAG: hypothetical protein ACK4FB_00090 [Brevundimonas sp.]|uniref:hypothetical protein n=1 Tax=Brevundimonas sp. TaxID=1871086 RepID=UPI00391B948E